MKLRALLLCCWLTCCLTVPVSLCAAQSPETCIILMQVESGLLSRQTDKLHQLIDILPDDCLLGIGFCGSPELMAPLPLTLSRRADLHASLQTAASLPQATERDWAQLIGAAIAQFPVGRVAARNRLILVQSNGETTTDWTLQAAAMAERQVQAVLLTEQTGGSTHPLVKQSGGQQRVLDGNSLSVLAQQLGLASGELLQASASVGSVLRSFHLDEAVQGIVLMIERAEPAGIRLLSPAGESLTAEAGITHFLATPTYICLHVNRQGREEFAWSGDWQLTMPEQAVASLWLVDPVQLAGTATGVGGSRLITASVWRNGEHMTGAALGTNQLVLRDQMHQRLLALNDIGLNGDQTADDGVFSGLLPDWLHPLAGKVVLEVQGYVYRSAELNLPAADPLALPLARSIGPLVPAIAAALSGVAGLVTLCWPRAASWQLLHRSANGYRRRVRCNASQLYAGSDQTCGLRLAASTGRRHLRLVGGDGQRLTMEVLSAEPATFVNGQRVFLRQELAHGDLIEVGGDQLLVENLSKLRIGRRQLGQAGRDLAADGQSNR